MDRYTFLAIFEPGEPNEDGYTVTFPDLPGCITEGDNLDEARRHAQEALELHLYSMENDQDSIPAPSDPANMDVPEGAFLVPIDAWMTLIRDEMENKAIKKTLSIPQWLNDVAEKEKINFSQLLQHAIKERLGIHDHQRPE